MLPADQNYPSDFYVTAATVIPVLYLAFVVQGPSYERMIKTAVQYLARSFSVRSIPSFLWAANLSGGLLTLALMIVVLPIATEVLALLALGRGADTIAERSWIMTAVVLLLVTAAIPPLMILVRAIVHVFKDTAAVSASKNSDMNTEKLAPDGSSQNSTHLDSEIPSSPPASQHEQGTAEDQPEN